MAGAVPLIVFPDSATRDVQILLLSKSRTFTLVVYYRPYEFYPVPLVAGFPLNNFAFKSYGDCSNKLIESLWTKKRVGSVEEPRRLLFRS